MHELQLMRQIVRQVESSCREQGGRPILVRLQLPAHSHLAAHSPTEIQALFQFASKGTFVDSASLEVMVVPTMGTCQSCGHATKWEQDMVFCPYCESGTLTWDETQEIVLQEIEYVEEGE